MDLSGHVRLRTMTVVDLELGWRAVIDLWMEPLSFGHRSGVRRPLLEPRARRSVMDGPRAGRDALDSLVQFSGSCFEGSRELGPFGRSGFRLLDQLMDPPEWNLRDEVFPTVGLDARLF